MSVTADKYWLTEKFVNSRGTLLHGRNHSYTENYLVCLHYFCKLYIYNKDEKPRWFNEIFQSIRDLAKQDALEVLYMVLRDEVKYVPE